MDDSKQRSRRQTPRPFFGPRPPAERPTPPAAADATRVTPTRGRPRLFTPPGAAPAVGVAFAPRAATARRAAPPGREHESARRDLEGRAASGDQRRLNAGARRGAAPEGAESQRAALDELKEVEPWALPAGEASDPDPGEHVAEALERVARRIRTGEIILPPDSSAESDEAALALALAALLQSPVR
jgi:hypothetical protein